MSSKIEARFETIDGVLRIVPISLVPARTSLSYWSKYQETLYSGKELPPLAKLLIAIVTAIIFAAQVPSPDSSNQSKAIDPTEVAGESSLDTPYDPELALLLNTIVGLLPEETMAKVAEVVIPTDLNNQLFLPQMTGPGDPYSELKGSLNNLGINVGEVTNNLPTDGREKLRETIFSLEQIEQGLNDAKPYLDLYGITLPLAENKVDLEFNTNNPDSCGASIGTQQRKQIYPGGELSPNLDPTVRQLMERCPYAELWHLIQTTVDVDSDISSTQFNTEAWSTGLEIALVIQAMRSGDDSLIKPTSEEYAEFINTNIRRVQRFQRQITLDDYGTPIEGAYFNSYYALLEDLSYLIDKDNSFYDPARYQFYQEWDALLASMRLLEVYAESENPMRDVVIFLALIINNVNLADFPTIETDFPTIHTAILASRNDGTSLDKQAQAEAIAALESGPKTASSVIQIGSDLYFRTLEGQIYENQSYSHPSYKQPTAIRLHIDVRDFISSGEIARYAVHEFQSYNLIETKLGYKLTLPTVYSINGKEFSIFDPSNRRYVYITFNNGEEELDYSVSTDEGAEALQ